MAAVPHHASAHPTVKQELLIVAAILLATLLVRLYGLTTESIWLDEATSIWLARMSLPDLVRWTAVDIHPPFYYMTLHVWLLIGDGEAQVRLLSVVMGVAGVATLYLLARRLFNLWVAMAAAALLALSPLHVWYSQETRMYAMLTLLGLLTSYLMVRALLDNSRPAWIGYAACAILMLYTHYYALFVLLFQNVVAAYLAWHGDIERQALGRWIVMQVVAALAFLPWLPVMIGQVRSGGGGWVARTGVPSVRDLAGVASLYTLGPDLAWYAPLLRRAAYAVCGLLVLVGLFSGRRQGHGLSVGVAFCLLYLVVPVTTSWAVSQAKPLFSQRYLLPFLPPYYILLANGLDTLRTSIVRPSAARWLWAAALAALLVVGGIGIVGSATHEQQADWRGIATYIVSNAQPDDVVVFVPGWNWKPFDYYARGRVALEGDTPIPLTATEVPRLVDDAIKGRTRLWLVQAEGHYADPDNALRSYLDRTYRRLDSRTLRDNIIVSLYQINP